MTTLPSGTNCTEWFDSLPKETQKALNELSDEARRNEKSVEVPHLGAATLYLDACSAGVDRGGYVPFLRFEDVKDAKGSPVVLEWCDDCWAFEGRNTDLN